MAEYAATYADEQRLEDDSARIDRPILMILQAPLIRHRGVERERLRGAHGASRRHALRRVARSVRHAAAGSLSA